MRRILGAVWRLLPVPVRRILDFDVRGMISIVLWVVRRRAGVPPGAVAVSYAREQVPILMVFISAMVVETAGLDLVLRAVHTPPGLRHAILFVDLYGILFALGYAAACATRPHVVTADELRIRYGAFFDLRVPRELISSVRLARNFNEKGMVRLDGDLLAVGVAAQTNVLVELTEPIEVVRPLGRRAEARTIRFFADDPAVALDALRHRQGESAPAH
jgi:hypothetical protein